MTDLYRLITDEQWEQIPRHERAGYVVSGGVMVKVKPTDRILWCPGHRSRQKNRVCEKADALWEAGQMYLLEGEECSFIEVDLVRVDDPYKEPSFIDGRNI